MKVTRMKTIMVHNCPYVCLGYTSRPTNSAQDCITLLFTSSTSPRHLLFALSDIGNVAGTAQQQAYPKAYSPSVKVSGILLPHRTATQHSGCSRLPTNSQSIKLQQSLLATLALHWVTVSRRTYSLLDFFAPHGLQNTLL